MKKIILLFLFITSNLIATAQTFQSSYGDSIQDQGLYFIPSNDNGFFILVTRGYNLAGSANYILKVNQYGDSLNVSSLNGIPNFSEFCSNCKDNFVLLNGVSTLSGPGQYLDTLSIYTVDTLGNLISTFSYPDTFQLVSPQIIRTDDNGYLISSGVWSYQYGARMLMMKIDANGLVQWKKLVLPYLIAEERSLGLIEDLDHNYIVEVIQANSGNWGGSKTMFKMDSLGNMIWTTSLTYGYPGSQTQQIVLADSGYIYIDNTASVSNSTGNSRISLVDTNGVLKWSKIFFDTNTYYSNIIPRSSGGYFICGKQATTNVSNRDVLFTTLNQSADSISSFSFGLDSMVDLPAFISELVDGRIAVTGLSTIDVYNNTKSDVYFAVSDTNGILNYILENKNGATDFEIFPNPCLSQFTLRQSVQKLANVTIVNLFGEIVFKTRVHEPIQTINLNLGKGIYFIKVNDQVRKLIIE